MSGLAEAVAQVRGQTDGDIPSLRVFVNNNFPDVVKALRNVDYENTRPKRRKGFNLVKVESKKHGFLYYARFSHDGKTLPTKFNTHTNNLAAAEQFAIENKTRLVEGYLARQDGRMFTVLEGFYDNEQNLYISDKSRKEYAAMIRNKFIPFLRPEKIATFDEITRVTLIKFQDSLLAAGLKAQSVNNNMKTVKKILAALARTGKIADNPGDRVRGIKVHEKDRKERGCYDLEKIQGVFNKRWKDEESYILCLLVYTTGMRNCEIKRLSIADIQLIDGCRFVSVKKSKTPNGVRLVPLHDFVYRKLKAWAAKNKKDTASLLFDYRNEDHFKAANHNLAKMLKVSDEELKSENITFYSGRHYWKTLMSAEGLGEDVEEIFMGHKVVGDVKKLYNHRDKQGKRRLVKKARQGFSILDRYIFNRAARETGGGTAAVRKAPRGRRGGGGAATAK
jgi:integrase